MISLGIGSSLCLQFIINPVATRYTSRLRFRVALFGLKSRICLKSGVRSDLKFLRASPSKILQAKCPLRFKSIRAISAAPFRQEQGSARVGIPNARCGRSQIAQNNVSGFNSCRQLFQLNGFNIRRHVCEIGGLKALGFCRSIPTTLPPFPTFLWRIGTMSPESTRDPGPCRSCESA